MARQSPAAGPLPTLMDAPPQRTHSGPLLVAGEDTEHTRGVLHLAQELARRDRVAVHVLGVIRPLGLPGAILEADDRQAWEEGRRQMHLRRLRQRLYQAVGQSALFTVEVVTGSPAPTLAAVAGQRGAELILVGVEEQGGEHRTATEDAALQITRAADVPTLAVPAEHALLPKRALVAMDFTPASQRAATAVLPLLAQGAQLTLVYVAPELDLEVLGQESWAVIHERGVDALFEQLIAQLSVPGDVAVETVLLHGDPAGTVLRLAQEGGFDLVSTGTQGQTSLDRHLTGSVSTAILRGAPCPVLIAPPPSEAV